MERSENPVPEIKLLIDGLRVQRRAQRLDQERTVFSLSKRMDHEVDLSAVPVTKTIRCRITQADVDLGNASPDDLGKFWFCPGYSVFGGGDIMRP